MAPFELQGREHEGELIHAIRCQLRQIQVLQIVDAVAVHQPLVSLERSIRVLAGDGLHRPGIPACHDDLLLDQPLYGGHSRPGVRGAVSLIVHHPQRAVTRVEKDYVAFANLDALLLQRALDVLDGDDIVDLEPLYAFVRGNVQQQAACEEGADVLDSQLGQPVRASYLRELEAVVKDVLAVDARTDVSQPIELRPDLTDLAAKQLIVIHQMAVPEGAARRQPGYRQTEVAIAEQRHPEFIGPAKLIDHPSFDEAGSFDHLLGGDPVCRAGLIIGAPFGRPPYRAGGRLRGERPGHLEQQHK